MKVAPLFYASSLAAHDVALLAAGAIDSTPVDVLDFPDEKGGNVAREMGVPLLVGMDDIQVEEASLRLRAKAKPMDIAFQATNVAGGGVVVSLSEPRRVRKIEIQYADPVAVPALHLVVRIATGTPGNFQFGPPIFADPPFALPSPMFAAVLGGMTVSAVKGGGKMLSFPAQLGTAWLIQLATGDEATSLSPMAINPTVRSVMADLLPENLSLVLAAGDGPITLWSHPNLLLPESGFQAVSFLPVAQKHLAKNVKSIGKSTLTVPLTFHSDSGCQVEIADQQLTAEYRVKPLAEDPLTLSLRGGWNALKLSAPAGRRPVRAIAELTTKLLGRVLNAGSPEPPIDAPGAGWRVDQMRQVAAARPFLPVNGAGAAQLASVRVLAEATKDSEVVLELRSDAAGLPGAALAKPVPLQVKQGTTDWLEFVLPQPIVATAGGGSIWAALRVTRGEILWFAGAPAANGARISIDAAKTWAIPEAPLAPAADPWLQLFHVVPDSQPRPILRLRHGPKILASDLMASAVRQGPREFRAQAAALPVGDVLAATSGPARAETVLHVFSTSAADLTVTGASLAYDPFASVSGG